MRQTSFLNPKRAAAIASFYNRSADFFRRGNAPESDIGSAWSSTGRPETILHSDVPCRIGQTRGIGEREFGSTTLSTANFTVGLQGVYTDIRERDEVEIDGVRYNIVHVGVQRLTQRTRMRVARKPDA